MAFGDVKTPKGLQELNNFLAEQSYISGYEIYIYLINIFENYILVQKFKVMWYS